jgi:hypothetical protein
MKDNYLKKYNFVRITKSGSTSIWKTLKRSCGEDIVQFGRLFKYSDYRYDVFFNFDRYTVSMDIKKYVGSEKWDNCFKFSFVRNPFDRMVSSWCHVDPDPRANRIELTFKDYVTLVYDIAVNKKTPREVGIRFNWYSALWHAFSQSSLIMDEKGNLMVDFLGRFENLQEDFDKLSDIIGVDREVLPHLKKGNKSHYRDYYDKETKSMVEEICKDDIRNFGFKFEE